MCAQCDIGGIKAEPDTLSRAKLDRAVARALDVVGRYCLPTTMPMASFARAVVHALYTHHWAVQAGMCDHMSDTEVIRKSVIHHIKNGWLSPGKNAKLLVAGIAAAWSRTLYESEES